MDIGAVLKRALGDKTSGRRADPPVRSRHGNVMTTVRAPSRASELLPSLLCSHHLPRCSHLLPPFPYSASLSPRSPSPLYSHNATSPMRPPLPHHESSERNEHDERFAGIDGDAEGDLPPLLAEVRIFVVPGKLDLREVYEKVDALGAERVIEPDAARVVVTGLRGAPRLERALGRDLVSTASESERSERRVRMRVGSGRLKRCERRAGRERLKRTMRAMRAMRACRAWTAWRAWTARGELRVDRIERGRGVGSSKSLD